jgi:hypothetical protein
MSQQGRQRFKDGRGSKEKINQKSVGKKSKKINIFRSERMTCGTHEAAASSTFPRRHRILKKAK